MKKMSSFLLSVAITTAAFALSLSGPASSAQIMDHSGPTVPSTELTITGLDGKSITLTPDAIGAMPHKTVSVYNAHTEASEKYSGVPLSDLLNRAGVPQGEKVHGKLFQTAVIAEGTDKYSVLYALAEVDPTIHTGDVIVADAVDGQKARQGRNVQVGLDGRKAPSSDGSVGIPEHFLFSCRPLIASPNQACALAGVMHGRASVMA